MTRSLLIGRVGHGGRSKQAMYFTNRASVPAPGPVCRVRGLSAFGPAAAPGRRVSRPRRGTVPFGMAESVRRGQTCTFFGLSSCATLLLSLALAKR